MKSDAKIRSLPDVIKKYAASTQLKLPVFPGAALELRQLLTSDDSSVDQISEVINKDQAIATHVLKLANSPFYSGMNRTIRTIRDAIMRLGSNHILNLVIVSCQYNYYTSQNNVLAKYLQTLWQHVLCVSVGSQWLIRKIGYRKLEDEAFLAGLLHDIGKLFIIKIIESAFPNDRDIYFSDAFILQSIESMHTEQGYKLLDAWSIPLVYCNISLNHHKQDFDKNDILLMAVRIANQVSWQTGVNADIESPVNLAAAPEVEALAINEYILSDLETVMLDVVQSEYSMLNELRLDNSTPYGIYL